MAVEHGSKGQLIHTSTPALAFTNEALTNSGDDTTFFIPVGQEAKRYWDRETAMVFETSEDGNPPWTPVVPASIQYVGGRVTFPGAVTGATPSARIASGKYLPWAAIGDIVSYSFDFARDEHDTTALTTTSSPTRNRIFLMGLAGGNFTISKFLANAIYAPIITTFTKDTLVASIVLDVEAGFPRIESYGYLANDAIETPIDDLITQELDFRIDGKFYVVTS